MSGTHPLVPFAGLHRGSTAEDQELGSPGCGERQGSSAGKQVGWRSRPDNPAKQAILRVLNSGLALSQRHYRATHGSGIICLHLAVLLLTFGLPVQILESVNELAQIMRDLSTLVIDQVSFHEAL